MTWTDDEFRAWMMGNLARAAAELEVQVTGEPVLGWNMRSTGAAARDAPRPRRWLRVGSERTANAVTFAPMWTGMADANAVQGVPKPDVVASTEWAVPEFDRAVRADLMTWVDATPCAREEILRAPVSLPDRWWQDLRTALDTLRATPTTRWADQDDTRNARRLRRVRDVFGPDVAARVAIAGRETGHGDLHWSNVAGPGLVVLDWEMWGLVPTGADVAGLYCRALLAPDTARRVRAVFGDVLNSREGRTAQVLAAAALIARGEWPELEGPLRHHVHTLVAEAA